MPPPSDAIAWYDANAASAAARFEAYEPADLHGWLLNLLPQAPAVIMDVGAGSGRDAAWLARLGHEVLAVEPSAAMRAEARRMHPEANGADQVRQSGRVAACGFEDGWSRPFIETV